MKFNFKERFGKMKAKFKGFTKTKKVLASVGLSILCLGFACAIWGMFGWSGSATANVIGQNPEFMLEEVTLEDFGVLDFSVGELSYVKGFTLESPTGTREAKYNVFLEVTATELNPDCNYTEDEITFRLFKTGGYGFIGEILNGMEINTANNPVVGASTYELNISAEARNVCPVDYEADIQFIPLG